MPPPPHMTWYYRHDDGHTIVKVFMAGNKLGELRLSKEEFNATIIWHNLAGFIKFVDETGQERLLPQRNQPRG